LVNAFFDGLQGKSVSQFLPLFSRLLRASAMSISHNDPDTEIMTRWQEVLSTLRKKGLPYKQPDVTVDIDGLLCQGCILIAEIAERTHSNLRGHAAASIMMQFDVIRDINAAVDTQHIIDTLAQDLPKLGIRTCALALYEGKPIPPPLSRLLMACHNGKRLELEMEGRLFPSEQLIPPGVLPGRRLPFLIVHPLTAHDVHFGFILMEIVPGRQMIYNAYEELLEQVGLALHRALLQQQIRQSNQQLQQRAAELAEANTQLEQFAYVASHDLQEPLRMVTSYLQLVEKRYKDRLDADANEFIGYAVDGAARMKRMINDLLAYSRVSTRSRPLELTSCEDLLIQTLSNLEVAIMESSALITHDPLPTVKADSTQLMAVFQNLIGNAIKFHAEKQPRIHVSAERQGKEWLFCVQDNGIGIAPEQTERVFAIFSRLHPAGKYPGSGIGLAICKKVVERHGGRIWFDSQPGEGTTFFFTIPARD
jgi:signal transduction histidine kinase